MPPPAKKSRLNNGQTHATSSTADQSGFMRPEIWNEEEEGDEILPRHTPRSTDDYVSRVIAHRQESNKENRPSAGKAGAAQSSTRQHTATESSNKRSAPQDVEEDSSEDEEFMVDNRVPAKKTLPSVAAAAAAKQRRPTKRARVEDSEEAQPENPASAFNNSETGTPPPTFQQVSRLANAEAELARLSAQTYRSQGRRPWSLADEEHLISLIRDYGCKWAVLARREGFSREYGQGDLKDKARNMVVKYYRYVLWS